MPDDAQLDRFRPRFPEVQGPPTGAQQPFVPALHVQAVPTEAAPTTTWDEWSHVNRDVRERRALVSRIRGDRGNQGLQHAQAVAAYRSLVRKAAIKTLSMLVTFGFLWSRVIGARDAAIAAGMGDRSFAPAGIAVLVGTLVAAFFLLRMWSAVSRTRPGPLHFAPLPDSPEAPRHGAFDGTTTPPTRW